MKVYLYIGARQLFEKSGVGHAIEHQKEMLADAGVTVEQKLSADTDVVHINTVFPDAVLMALWARLHGKPVVYYGHSTMEDFRNSFKCSDLLAPLFRRWIMRCYSLGNLVITPTEYSKRLLVGYGIQKPVYALSNGVDVDFFRRNPLYRMAFRRRYGIADEGRAVMSVGHYMARKGILEFIALAKTMPDTLFFWFGYTNLNLVPSRIREAIEGAPENVRFPGYVDSTALREAYCGCDLFCFMSREETEGIVVLEALACEIPVLLRDIPVYKDWLTDGVNVYKAGKQLEFLIKANKILSGELPDLTEEGRKTAQARSLQNVSGELMKKYQTLKSAS